MPCNFRTLFLLFAGLVQEDAADIQAGLEDGSIPKSEEVYNYLIRVFGAQRRFGDAMDVLRSMASAGIPPSLHTFTAAISACAAQRNGEAAVDILTSMRKAGVQPDSVAYGAAMDALVRSGRLDAAFDLLNDMDAEAVPVTVDVWTHLLAGCYHAGDLDRQWATWDHMRRYHAEPDAVAFSVMMAACGRADRHERAMNLHTEMLQAGVQPTHVTFNALIYSAARSMREGVFQQAHALVQQMKAHGLAPDRRTYNAALLACSQSGDVNRAKDYMKSMSEEGVRPDIVTFNTLLSVYARGMTYVKARTPTGEEAQAALVDIATDGVHLLGEGTPALNPAEEVEVADKRFIVPPDAAGRKELAARLLQDYFARKASHTTPEEEELMERGEDDPRLAAHSDEEGLLPPVDPQALRHPEYLRLRDGLIAQGVGADVVADMEWELLHGRPDTDTEDSDEEVQAHVQRRIERYRGLGRDIVAFRTALGLPISDDMKLFTELDAAAAAVDGSPEPAVQAQVQALKQDGEVVVREGSLSDDLARLGPATYHAAPAKEALAMLHATALSAQATGGDVGALLQSLASSSCSLTARQDPSQLPGGGAVALGDGAASSGEESDGLMGWVPHSREERDLAADSRNMELLLGQGDVARESDTLDFLKAAAAAPGDNAAAKAALALALGLPASLDSMAAVIDDNLAREVNEGVSMDGDAAAAEATIDGQPLPEYIFSPPDVDSHLNTSTPDWDEDLDFDEVEAAIRADVMFRADRSAKLVGERLDKLQAATLQGGIEGLDLALVQEGGAEAALASVAPDSLQGTHGPALGPLNEPSSAQDMDYVGNFMTAIAQGGQSPGAQPRASAQLQSLATMAADSQDFSPEQVASLAEQAVATAGELVAEAGDAGDERIPAPQQARVGSDRPSLSARLQWADGEALQVERHSAAGPGPRPIQTVARRPGALALLAGALGGGGQTSTPLLNSQPPQSGVPEDVAASPRLAPKLARTGQSTALDDFRELAPAGELVLSLPPTRRSRLTSGGFLSDSCASEEAPSDLEHFHSAVTVPALSQRVSHFSGSIPSDGESNPSPRMAGEEDGMETDALAQRARKWRAARFKSEDGTAASSSCEEDLGHTMHPEQTEGVLGGPIANRAVAPELVQPMVAVWEGATSAGASVVFSEDARDLRSVPGMAPGLDGRPAGLPYIGYDPTQTVDSKGVIWEPVASGKARTPPGLIRRRRAGWAITGWDYLPRPASLTREAPEDTPDAYAALPDAKVAAAVQASSPARLAAARMSNVAGTEPTGFSQLDTLQAEAAGALSVGEGQGDALAGGSPNAGVDIHFGRLELSLSSSAAAPNPKTDNRTEDTPSEIVQEHIEWLQVVTRDPSARVPPPAGTQLPQQPSAAEVLDTGLALPTPDAPDAGLAPDSASMQEAAAAAQQRALLASASAGAEEDRIRALAHMPGVTPAELASLVGLEDDGFLSEQDAQKQSISQALQEAEEEAEGLLGNATRQDDTLVAELVETDDEATLRLGKKVYKVPGIDASQYSPEELQGIAQERRRAEAPIRRVRRLHSKLRQGVDEHAAGLGTLERLLVDATDSPHDRAARAASSGRMGGLDVLLAMQKLDVADSAVREDGRQQHALPVTPLGGDEAAPAEVLQRVGEARLDSQGELQDLATPGSVEEHRVMALKAFSDEVMAGVQWLSKPLPTNVYEAREVMLREAKGVFGGEMAKAEVQPDIVTLNTMVQMFARAGRPKEAYAFIDREFRAAGEKPDERTFRWLVAMHEKAKRIDVAEQLVALMEDHGLRPSEQILGTLVHGYAREYRIRDAIDVLQHMSDQGMTCPERFAHLVRMRCREMGIVHPAVPRHPEAWQFSRQAMKKRLGKGKKLRKAMTAARKTIGGQGIM